MENETSENVSLSSLSENDGDFEENVELLRVLSCLSESTNTYTPFIDTLEDDDIIELTTTIYEMIDDYIKDNLLYMCDADFHSKMENEITHYLVDNWEDAELCDIDINDDDSNNNFNSTLKFVKNAIHDYFHLGNEWSQKIPIRSSKNANINIEQNKSEISKTIDYLRSIPQPEQRTSEWYKFRRELITASNVGKIFGTEASRNSLIYEKCLPIKIDDEVTSSNGVNIMSPLHWGQKYEPLSVMLYEDEYNTTIEDFGCIQHNKYSFIGASPDGINIDSASNKYGRMLEIKNIVNREITGIPSKMYWIQMQIQMETCGLNYCDFLETQFKEYENEEEFYNDTTHQRKGVILHFIERISIGGGISTSPKTNEIEITRGYQLAQQTSGAPKYIYMPLDIELTKSSIDEWIEITRNKLRRSWSLYSIDFWYLEKLSCVLVERNQQWFQKVCPLIKETWNTILQERKTGYDHRAAKKRPIKTPGLEIVPGTEENSRIIKNLPVSGGVCLVKLEPDDVK